MKDVLVQAVLAAPMFATRWRWVTNTGLAVLRHRAGKKVPAPFQRNDADDLIALVFPCKKTWMIKGKPYNLFWADKT